MKIINNLRFLILFLPLILSSSETNLSILSPKDNIPLIPREAFFQPPEGLSERSGFIIYPKTSNLFSEASQSPQLSISNGNTIDQKIEIKIDGVDPFQIIELKAKAEDQKGILWTSKALFQADELGSVDITKSTPLENSSYTIADPMGLFWSMTPPTGQATSNFHCKNDSFSVNIGLYVQNKLIDEKNILRYLKKPEIQQIEVKENGLVGTLFIPKSDALPPVIITLSGSNGGISETRAKLLASNGFAVLALGYFGIDELPSNLENIPLEYFERAFSWLKKQSNIDGSRMGIYGVSRGAELSLILGSIFPNSIQAIVAVAPSSVVYGGMSEKSVPAWLYKNKPIAESAPVLSPKFTDGQGQTSQYPANTRQNFLKGMKNQSAFEAAAIPVEKIQCPLLLISGGDDQMWPSEIFANQILTRLKLTDSKTYTKHLNYPNAGHGINVPNLPIPEPIYYHPIAKLWFSMGGSREADAKASFDAWNHLVTFFHEALSSQGRAR